MGEPNMQILETNVQHNTEDIRELKKRMHHVEKDAADLKIDSQTSKQNISHIYGSLAKFESTMADLSNKIDADRKERHNDQISQLKEYKSAVWQVGIYLTGLIIGGYLLLHFGLK